VDQMRIGQIREQVILQMGSDPEMALLTVQQRKQLEEERVRVRVEQLGLDRPFMIREFRVPVEWTKPSTWAPRSICSATAVLDRYAISSENACRPLSS